MLFCTFSYLILVKAVFFCALGHSDLSALPNTFPSDLWHKLHDSVFIALKKFARVDALVERADLVATVQFVC